MTEMCTCGHPMSDHVEELGCVAEEPDGLLCACGISPPSVESLRKELKRARALLSDCMNFDSLAAERYVAIKHFLEEGGDGSEG